MYLRKEEIEMANLVQKYIDIAIAKNPGEPEFHQTIEEVSYFYRAGSRSTS